MHRILSTVNRSYSEMEATVNFLIESYNQLTPRKRLLNVVKLSMTEKTNYLAQEKLISSKQFTMFEKLSQLKLMLESFFEKIWPDFTKTELTHLRSLMFEFSQMQLQICHHLTHKRLSIAFPFGLNKRQEE